jgi:hypothetical protein
MANQHLTLNVTSRFNDFLFASICDEPDGTRLSVLSALARTNVDPWEEAARLATLSTLDAQETLVSTLNLFPAKRQGPAETEILAARLVALLPKADKATGANAATIVAGHAQRTIYWLAWLCFAIAMSFLSPHQPAPTTSAGDSASKSRNTTPPAEGAAAKPAPSAVNSRTD